MTIHALYVVFIHCSIRTYLRSHFCLLLCSWQLHKCIGLLNAYHNSKERDSTGPLNMYRVFSRQTESAELCSTALGLHEHTAKSMDAYNNPGALGCVAARDAGRGLAYAAQTMDIDTSRASSPCALERQPTPAVFPDNLIDASVFSPRRHRRSCHGTVLDDEQQGGTAVSRSCQAPAHDNINSSDGMAYVIFHGKAISGAKTEVVCKDVSSRQQSDQKQQQHGAIHVKDTAAHSFQPSDLYDTPFAAPEVQACRCHKRYQQCKQHNNGHMKKLTNKFRRLVQCGGCAAAY